MIVIGTVTFPESSSNEVAECYKNLPALPDFIRIDGTYVNNNASDDKFHAFSIFNFDEKDLDGANAYFDARYEAFSKVPGLTSTHEEWLDVKDALSIVEAGTYDLDMKII